ncbi:MAG: ATP synthase A1 subunit C [Halobacteriota archaeon]|nr:ATP synthase A1 subunit C [Halobacteriota archaeon]
MVGFDEFLTVFGDLGFSDPVVGLVLVTIVALAVFIVIIVPILKPIILDIAPFAYPNARIRAMESKLLPKTKLEEMIELSSVVDVLGYLEGTDYEAQFARIRGSPEEASSIELALYESRKDSYQRMISIAPDSIKEIFSARFKLYEVKLLKSVLRSLHAGVPIEMNLTEIPVVGRLDVEAFLNLQSTEEFISKLEDTEYGTPLAEAIAIYSDKKDVQPIEMALDRFAYEKLWNVIRTVSEQNIKALKYFFGTEVDAINLRTIMRAKADGLSLDQIKDYILPMGYELNVETLNSLADMPDIEGMVSMLEGKKCGLALEEAVQRYEAKKSIIPLEMALEVHVAQTGRNVSVSQPFGIGPFVGFLCNKDVEVRNLRAIVRGIEAGVNKDLIKDMLVTF